MWSSSTTRRFPRVVLDVMVPAQSAAADVTTAMVSVDGVPVESLSGIDPATTAVAVVVDDRPEVDAASVGNAQGAALELAVERARGNAARRLHPEWPPVGVDRRPQRGDRPHLWYHRRSTRRRAHRGSHHRGGRGARRQPAARPPSPGVARCPRDAGRFAAGRFDRSAGPCRRAVAPAHAGCRARAGQRGGRQRWTGAGDDRVAGRGRSSARRDQGPLSSGDDGVRTGQP